MSDTNDTDHLSLLSLHQTIVQFMRPHNFINIAFFLQLLTNNNDPASRERWQRQQSLELEEGEVDKVENASATISIIIINILKIAPASPFL